MIRALHKRDSLCGNSGKCYRLYYTSNHLQSIRSLILKKNRKVRALMKNVSVICQLLFLRILHYI